MEILNRLRADFNFRIKTLQLVNILLCLVGAIYLLVDFKWSYFLISIGVFLIFGIIGANAGLHRYFSHRTYQINRFWQIVLALIGTICTLGSIISWTAIHRYHHQHADTPQDPHSPQYIGAWRAYTYDWNRAAISKKFIQDVMRDPVLVFLHRHYFMIISIYVALLVALDPWLAIYAYAIPVTGCLNGVAAVTVIGHTHGYSTHAVKDTSRNSWIANIMSLGEGWHNNHHARPYSWRQGEMWWELDPPSWFIRLIKQ